MVTGESLSRKLKELRLEYGNTENDWSYQLTMDRLAEHFKELGYPSINRQRIQKLETPSTARGIKAYEIEAYCKFFNVTADNILFGLPNENRPINKLGLSGKSVKILEIWNTHESKEGWFDHALDGLNAVLEYEYDYYIALKNGRIEENPKKKTNRHHFPLLNDIWHFLHVPLDDVAEIHLTDGVILGRDAKPILESVVMRDISARLHEISSWMNKSKK